jgi:hypothetical protein
MEPTVRFPPTAPFTLQMTPVFEVPFTVAAYWDEVPRVTLVAPVRVSVTAGGGGGGATSVIVRLRTTEGSAKLAAAIVTFEEPGSTAGAVYNPVAEMEPMVWFPPTTPLTLQITPVFELPFTVAAYCDELPNVTVAVPVRVSVTVGGGGEGATRVTLRLRTAEGSATLVAVIVTFEEPGSTAGAL